MLYHVTHRIRYIYSASVFLEPHIILLRPRCDADQRVREFSMSVDPKPSGIHDFLDPEGNNATCIWFDEQVSSLNISTAFDVQTLGANPFSYLVADDTFFHLPVRYGKEYTASLAQFLKRIEPGVAAMNFAKSIIDETKGETIDFLARLCSVIYENFTVETRIKGSPLNPSITIKNKRGACRDLALLFVEACRSVGLAARFVSGYQEGDPDMEHPHLHAWAEVYIPGGGWRGYDPTHGLAVADRHIALAASHGTAGASPVRGTFRGTGVTAEMDYNITLSLIPEHSIDY